MKKHKWVYIVYFELLNQPIVSIFSSDKKARKFIEENPNKKFNMNVRKHLVQ